MIYKLKFLPIALKEWKKLDATVRKQLKKKLEEVLENPKVPANQLRKFENHYKIKLRGSGYRLGVRGYRWRSSCSGNRHRQT